MGKFNTPTEALQYKEQLIREKKIIPKRRGRKPRCEEDRYIRRVRGKYMLQKSVNGKTQYFGTFKTLQEAREERNIFEQIGWNWENIDLV